MHTIAIDFDASTPLVTQIENHLRRQVEQQSLRAGMRLPSVRKFAVHCQVSTATVVSAYNRLAAAGYIEARRGSGYTVAPRVPARNQASFRSQSAPLIDSVRALMRAYDESPLQMHVGCGWLPAAWFDHDGIKSGLRAVSRSSGSHLVRYGNPAGYLPLRQQIQNRLASRGIDVAPDQIVMTAGASLALTLAMNVLTKPGDTVLCDDPAYSNLLLSLKQYGLKVHGVTRTPTGPDIDELQRLAVELRPKVFFTNSTLHNPTGTCYSPSTAFRVLQLAEQCNFMIVEDDIFSDLMDPPAQCLASLDELKRVIYVQSFSKSISPSMRVGYVASSAALAEAFVDVKTLSSLATSELNERVVYSILTSGSHRKHLDRLRERLVRAQDDAVARLTSAGMRIFHRPLGGMFLWARFEQDMDTSEVTATAAAEDIILAPGILYSVDGRPSPWFRFNVAHLGDARVFHFLESIAKGRR